MESSGFTKQRQAVLQVIHESEDHLTANEVFEHARRILPGISFATVYNSLRYLKQEGHIGEITFGTGASRYDMDRFGAGAFRATPRQADLMVVAGTVTYKMASRVRRLYNMMPDPKFVIARGACTVGGGPYFKYGYHVVKGVDLVVPVDVYVPGCPPRPEALLDALMKLQNKVQREPLLATLKKPGPALAKA